MKHTFTIILILVTTIIQSQSELLLDSIEQVTISASRIDIDLLKAPSSAHKINIESARIAATLTSLNEVLNEIPGTFAMNQYNSAQDLRISIRGFGARAAFGIRGVKLIANGIPLSTPDGQGQVDNVYVGSVKSIEILNGASSALYGNASGGVVSLNTFSESENSYQKLNASLGSYGFYNLAYDAHQQLNAVTIDNQISYVSSNGYRAFSESKNLIYNGRLKKKFSDRQQITFLLNGLYSPEGQDPGGINLESVAEDRRQARDQNETFDAGEELTQIGTSLQYEAKVTSNDQVKITGFYSRRDFENRLPFEFGGQVALLRNYGGLNLNYAKEFGSDKFQNSIVTGVEFEYQNDLRIRYLNLDGERGAETLNQNEKYQSTSAFITGQSIYGKVLFNAGLRYDLNRISLTDHFEADGKDDGTLNLPSLSPSLSWSYELVNHQFLSASFSYGFETPALSELTSRPDNIGGLNEALKPQQSYNYELGYKARFSDRFSLFASLFTVNSIDELLPYELEAYPGRTFYENAGRTSRQGVELNVSAKLAQYFSLSTAFTYSNFKFVDESENVLPGIPLVNFFLNLKFDNGPLSVSMQHRYISDIYADTANETLVDGYLMGNLSFAYQIKNFQPYLGINNIYNVDYFDNIRLNAFGSRYYEAGPPRNFYIGVKFDF
ncbi:TonB-dependent receptor family protein [Portibacter lacus]|uniref:TonB-dependent receptor n=1 Tax=Portibacter lacus TaxID=1099794 RepID=A0AA37SSR5_9BACT|nr:TonB-dependent receptor [Portibacter lacus]GLR17345.1 TonB-dependent receptor [Portibacter lacus]